MKKLKWLSFICLSLLFITSCIDKGNNGIFDCIEGEGGVVTEELLINEFKGVKLRGSSNVFITQGSPLQVKVAGQQNIIDNIETDIQGDIWEIEFEDCMRDYTKLNIYITMPVIENLEVSGSGDIVGQNDFEVTEIDLKVDGSGKIDVALVDATSVDANISGSGKILLEGASNLIDVNISGSGDVKAFNLETNIADVRITGSGDTELSVKDELKVKITGSGDVHYKGNPLIDVDITGSGSLVNEN